MKYLIISKFLFLSVLAATTGEVVVIGSVISSGTAPSGYDSTMAFDGNYLTAWAATPFGSVWIGIDAGQAITLTAVRISPRDGDNSNFYASKSNWSGTVIQASNSATFSSGVETLYTVPSYDTGKLQFYPGQMLEVLVSPTQTYRYFRLVGPTFGHVAEIRFIGTFVSSLIAQPIAPIITPGSGGYLTDPITVSINSRTTSAILHYTTDGSNPTCSSTIYSAPVSIPISSTTLVQAVACDADLSTQTSEISSQHYRNYGFQAGTVEYDNSGNLVHAVNGGITYFDGLYWKIGNNYQTPLATSGSFGYAIYGWFLYSSLDCIKWVFESQIIGNQGWTYIQRAHIIKNVSTGKYVVWGNVTNDFGSGSRAMILSADSPNGVWTVVDSAYNPGGLGFKDNNLFVDNDGIAYVVFTCGDQTRMAVMQLASDYLSVIGSPTFSDTTNGREAPAMFRRGQVYFLITSTSSPPTTYIRDVEYQTAVLPLSTWSGLSPFYSQTMTTVGVYNAQPESVVPIPGRLDAYMYVGDAWTSSTVTSPLGDIWYSLNTTTELYLPLVFPTATSVVCNVESDFPSGSWWFDYWAIPIGIVLDGKTSISGTVLIR